jgi:DNA-binding MarR family transcriptional regulator
MDKTDRSVELLDLIGRIVHGLQFALGLNPAQWEALRFLSRANRYSRSPSALAEFLGTTKGTASQTLIALESKGVIQRKRRASDRRSVDLEVTPLGLELIAKDPMGLVGEAVSRLGPDDREAMNAGLARVVADLQRSIGLPVFGPCLECTHLGETDGGPNARPVWLCMLSNDELRSHELERVCFNFKSVA